MLAIFLGRLRHSPGHSRINRRSGNPQNEHMYSAFLPVCGQLQASSEKTESLANGEQLKACYACSSAQPGLTLNTDWL